jgi:hypothetical protein
LNIAGATSPQQCVLLLAVPLTAEEVKGDLSSPDHHDYARSIEGADFLLPEAVFEAHFLPVAESWKTCRRQLERLGVKIIETASSAEVRRVLRDGFRTITIFGHWKGHQVLAGDIIDPVAVANRLLDSTDEIAELIRRTTDLSGVECIAAPSNGEPISTRAALAEKLTTAIEAEQALFDLDFQGSDYVGLMRQELSELNRQAIDNWLAETMISGNRLELRDGLFSPKQVAELGFSEFVGCVHLANCHSTILQRKLASPSRRVLGNEEILLPLTFFEVYCTVIALLGPGRPSYPELWLDVMESLRGAEPERAQFSWKESLIKRLSGFFRR